MTPSLDSQELATGSKDRRGCADYDQPYSFGRRPRERAPLPFTTRRYARLLAMRSRVAAGSLAAAAFQAQPFTACPKCAQDGGRDETARAILRTAGVLAA